MTATDGESMPSGRIFAEDKAGEHARQLPGPGGLPHQGRRARQAAALPHQRHVQDSPAPLPGAEDREDPHPRGQHRRGHRRRRHRARATASCSAKSVAGPRQLPEGRGLPQERRAEGAADRLLAARARSTSSPTCSTSSWPRRSPSSENQIGIVEAKDGLPMSTDDVVAATPEMKFHNSYQDGQAFLDEGGLRGPQQAVLRPGPYYINPYLFAVSTRPLTVIAAGRGGRADLQHRRRPEHARLPRPRPRRAEEPRRRPAQDAARGARGLPRHPAQRAGAGHVQHQPARLHRDRGAHHHALGGVVRTTDADKPFDPFTVVSHDGFEMQVEVRCQYRILPENAPFVIQKLGTHRRAGAQRHSPADRRHLPRPGVEVAGDRLPAEPRRGAGRRRAGGARRPRQVQRRRGVSVMITNIHLPDRADEDHAAEEPRRAGAVDVRREEEGRGAAHRVRAHQCAGRPAGSC